MPSLNDYRIKQYRPTFTEGFALNIKQAKDQIKNAVTVYFSKDEFGDYLIPPEVQRPVFLLGPPGIGKTAVMQQIAYEAGVGLISYSMTHHTRQSALGLPLIEHKKYDGKEYAISEYTMSEIIASVYEYIETTGVKEGILFLDEINCTSETLAPVMLQFLQYKTFGRHKLPNGWIVVTAGNPPEYNNSVREFDIATWDRLRRIEVIPDFMVWKEYAQSSGVHPAVFTYLETIKSDFYKIETTVDGRYFVTARGWLDLSAMLKLYEEKKIQVDLPLIEQYLQHPKVAKEFALYYDLFKKYRSDYQVSSILDGQASDEIIARARNAAFDERLALLGLMLNALHEDICKVNDEEAILKDLLAVLKDFKKGVKNNPNTPRYLFETLLHNYTNMLQNAADRGTVTQNVIRRMKAVHNILHEELNIIGSEEDNEVAFKAVKKDFDKRVKKMESDADKVVGKLNAAFKFAEQAFGEGQEILILLSELTINKNAVSFISSFGCDEYFKHNKELLFHERQIEIINVLNDLQI